MNLLLKLDMQTVYLSTVMVLPYHQSLNKYKMICFKWALVKFLCFNFSAHLFVNSYFL